MSREKQGTYGVQFSRQSAEQIAEVVREFHHGDRKAPGRNRRSAPQAAAHYLGKTSTAWAKNTKATITIYTGEPGSETSSGDTVDAWNKFAAVQSGKWVMLARTNGYWYLIAAEC